MLMCGGKVLVSFSSGTGVDPSGTLLHRTALVTRRERKQLMSQLA
jgi:hypothetical protein